MIREVFWDMGSWKYLDAEKVRCVYVLIPDGLDTESTAAIRKIVIAANSQIAKILGTHLENKGTELEKT